MAAPSIFQRLRRAITGAPAARSYAAAAGGRLNADWIAGRQNSANAEIGPDIHTLRARSRQLERDSDYVRAWLRLLDNNILGADGLKLQAKVRNAAGDLDSAANDAVEAAWLDFGHAGNCDTTGTLNWRDAQGLILRSVARDGGALIRLVRGADTRHRFQISILDIDALDVEHNGTTAAGNTIKFGVELDAWQRPVAYYITTTNGTTLRRERVSAREIIHAYRPDRPGQLIGAPWSCSAMQSIKMLAGYQEAELVSARIGACRGGFYTRNEQGEGFTGETTDGGQIVDDLSPGQFVQLPNGVGVQSFDVSHPNANYDGYTKAILRSIATGLGVSYASLAGDLTSVNFSSIRAGVLEERETFKTLQAWFAAHVARPIFAAWLEMATLAGAVSVTAPAHRQEFSWIGRRWPWVDPLKDITATALAIKSGLRSHRQAIAEAGGDVYETFEQLAEDKKLAAALGLTLADLAPVPADLTAADE